MSEKKKLDVTCPYCGKRYNKENLMEEGYVDETKLGLVVECPNSKCEAQYILNEN